MRWVTRKRIHVNRTATGWLARRFLDPGAECAGLWAISQGFTDVSRDDVEILDRASFLYDSLYAHLRRRVEAERSRE